MKIAIIYSTKIKATKKTSELLSNKINSETKLIAIEQAKTDCLLKYNYVILVVSIINGKVQGAIKRYISKNLKTLTEKPKALILICEDCENTEKKYNKAFSESLVNTSLLKSTVEIEFEKDNSFKNYKKKDKAIRILDLKKIDKIANNINKIIDNRI